MNLFVHWSELCCSDRCSAAIYWYELFVLHHLNYTIHIYELYYSHLKALKKRVAETEAYMHYIMNRSYTELTMVSKLRIKLKTYIIQKCILIMNKFFEVKSKRDHSIFLKLVRNYIDARRIDNKIKNTKKHSNQILVKLKHNTYSHK